MENFWYINRSIAHIRYKRLCFLEFLRLGPGDNDFDADGPEYEQDRYRHTEDIGRVAQTAEHSLECGEQERGDKLAKIQRGGNQRHNRCRCSLSCLHGALGDDERDTGSIGEANQGRTEDGADPAADIEEQESEEERDWGHKLGRSFAGLHDTEEQEASYGRNDVGEGHDNGNQAGGYHLVKLCCLHGIVGRVNEEAGHEKEHGHDIFVIGLEGLPNTGAIYLFLIRSFLRCAQLLVGQEDGAENHRDEPEKID